jgi:hypothetical protein
MSLLESYLPEKATADEIGATPRTLSKWRKERIGPAWTRIGRRIFYRRDAVLEWLRSQEEQPVRERGRRSA